MKCTIWVDLHSRCSVEPVSESNCLLNKRFDITFYCSMGKNLGMITLLNWLLHVPVVLQMEPPLKTHNWTVLCPWRTTTVYWLPLLTVTGCCSRNTVCFQWVGGAWGPVENITYTAIQERIMNIYCVSSNNIQGHLFKKTGYTRETDLSQIWKWIVIKVEYAKIFIWKSSSEWMIWL